METGLTEAQQRAYERMAPGVQYSEQELKTSRQTMTRLFRKKLVTRIQVNQSGLAGFGSNYRYILKD